MKTLIILSVCITASLAGGHHGVGGGNGGFRSFGGGGGSSNLIDYPFTVETTRSIGGGNNNNFNGWQQRSGGHQVQRSSWGGGGQQVQRSASGGGGQRQPQVSSWSNGGASSSRSNSLIDIPYIVVSSTSSNTGDAGNYGQRSGVSRGSWTGSSNQGQGQVNYQQSTGGNIWGGNTGGSRVSNSRSVQLIDYPFTVETFRSTGSGNTGGNFRSNTGFNQGGGWSR